MLNLDIGSLSESELQETVLYHCSQFGKVRGIKVREPAGGRGHGIAAVEMSTPLEADQVAVKIGDMKFGSTAIIRLLQEEKSIPVSLRREGWSERAPAVRAPLEILLVEDDPTRAQMAREALKTARVPHHLHVVDNGLDAVSFLFRTRRYGGVPEPDLILLKPNIPKLDGRGVLREIKANDDLKHIPVVVLSRPPAGDDDQESRDVDVDDCFLIKASSVDAFAQEMRNIASRIH